MKPPKLTAKDIMKLLAIRHKDDVFIPECKDGPTWGASHLRMDALVMKRSWSNQLSICHEVKVSRSDFLQDIKWPGYLDLCNEFYFVCPHKMIDKTEIDERAGLIYATKNGKSLHLIKKAQYREVELPECLYRHILMSRVQITREVKSKAQPNAEYWRDWLKDKEHHQVIGRSVSKELHKRLEGGIQAVTVTNNKLKRENDGLQRIKEILISLGMDPDRENLQWCRESLIRDAVEVIPNTLIDDMRSTIKKIEAFKSDARDMLKGGEDE